MPKYRAIFKHTQKIYNYSILILVLLRIGSFSINVLIVLSERNTTNKKSPTTCVVGLHLLGIPALYLAFPREFVARFVGFAGGDCPNHWRLVAYFHRIL